MVEKNKKISVTKPPKRVREWSQVVKAGGHDYTIDNDLGVWHWRSTGTGIGWGLIGQASSRSNAKVMIAEHSATAPLDREASRWAALPMRLAD